MAKADVKSELRITKAPDGSTATVEITGPIGFQWYDEGLNSYGAFLTSLRDLGPVAEIHMDINSPGGDLTDAIGIFNALVQHRAKVVGNIKGVAASAASMIAMAADELHMPENTLLHIHEPWGGSSGNAEQLRTAADGLDRFKAALTHSYMRHAKGDAAAVAALVGKETWLTAQEAAESFSNVVVESIKAAPQAMLPQAGLCTAEMPDSAKAFFALDEQDISDEDVGTLRRILSAVGLGKKLPPITEKPNEETDMTEAEQKAFKEEILASVATTVSAALTPAAPVVPATPATPKAEVVEFEGDKTDLEAVKAHLAKLEANALQAATDFSDPASVKKYFAALKGDVATGGASNQAPNTQSPTASLKTGEFTPEAVKAQVDLVEASMRS